MPAPSLVALDSTAEVLCAQLSSALDLPNVCCASSCKILVANTLDHELLHRVQLAILDDPDVRPARTLLVQGVGCRGAERALLAMGVGDVIEAGASMADVVCARLAHWNEIDTAMQLPFVTERLVGRSEVWQRALGAVAESAIFSCAPVLLTGPTGTGKELLARLLHTLDPRVRGHELVVVDCTTLSRELAGSELFGHERGAFTGAVSSRDGAIACAHGGTLYLDEVGELPVELQAQFLRVLQEKAFRRVGSTAWQRASFRLVCATNRHLPDEVAAGRFRADLYHRIAAITCRTPALAERRADIPALVRHFIAASYDGQALPEASAGLLEYLAGRDYPGNVRELEQLVLACLRRYAGAGPLSLASLPEEEIGQWGSAWDCAPAGATAAGPAAAALWRPTEVEDFVRAALRANIGLKELGRMVEAAAVQLALEESDSITAAANWLGVTPRALHLRKAAARGAEPRH